MRGLALGLVGLAASVGCAASTDGNGLGFGDPTVTVSGGSSADGATSPTSGGGDGGGTTGGLDDTGGDDDAGGVSTSTGGVSTSGDGSTASGSTSTGSSSSTSSSSTSSSSSSSSSSTSSSSSSSSGSTSSGGTTGGGGTVETVCKTMASREQLLDTPERWSRLDVSIPGDPTILDLDVSVSGYHTEIGAVRLRVEHPKGSSAQIIEYWTCAEDGFDIAGAAGGSIVVDDEAGQPLSAGCTAPDFDPGRYQANGAWLSSFDGLGANGQWTLWTQASFWPGYQGGNVLWDPQVFEWCLTVTY